MLAKTIASFVCLVAVFALQRDAAYAGDAPLKIHMVSGAGEYKSEESLKSFKEQLEKSYRVECTASWGKDFTKSLDNLDALKSADVLIVFARRMDLPPAQMEILRNHWENGKAVVGVRTAGHAFQKDDNDFFDRKVLGAHYKGHYGQEPVKVTTAKGAEDHPVLKGVKPFGSRNLYIAGELLDDSVVLQHGDNGAHTHPVTIVHPYKGGRMFYTSLGVQEDFQNENFRQILTNAVFWTAGRDPSRMKK